LEIEFQALAVTAEPGEAALIDALRSGDERAFARLVDSHHPSLLRVARLYVRDRGVAEEVVQETWLAVLEGIDRFEGARR
jgi:RNA polymerase sigma-70 factor (ECF subfamily)